MPATTPNPVPVLDYVLTREFNPDHFSFTTPLSSFINVKFDPASNIAVTTSAAGIKLVAPAGSSITNILSLGTPTAAGQPITSTVSGIASTVVIPATTPAATTNTLAITSGGGAVSTVNGVIATQAIPTTAGLNGSVAEQKQITVLGFDSTGALTQTKRRPLVRWQVFGAADVVSGPTAISTLALAANRLVMTWKQGTAATVAASAQQQVDAVFATNVVANDAISVGHAGWYLITASVFARLLVPSVTANMDFSVLMAFVIRSSMGAVENRFGEFSTSNSGNGSPTNSSLSSSGWDVSACGTQMLYLLPGDKIQVRTWPGGSNAASSAALATFSDFASTAYLTIAEMPTDTY